MKSIILLALLLVLCATLTNAQAPDSLWTRTYGATDMGEQGYCVQQTIEGGYIIAGLRYSLSSDVYVVCTNQLGYALWERVYGDPTVSDEAHDVQQTFDLGFIIVGSTVSSGREKVYLIKVNPFGVFMWHRTYGGGNCHSRGHSIQQTIEGGYIITGNTGAYPVGDHDVLLIKTDSLGDTLWTRTYGGGYDDFARSVQQTPDQGFIIAGFTNSFGQGAPTCFNFYLIKTDSLGDTLWTRAYGGGGDEKATAVRCTSDNGYVIVGTVGTSGSGCYIVRTDTSGDTIWTKTYSNGGLSIEGTADGGYILGGNCQGFYLLKISNNGDSLWARSYPTGNSDHCNMACATSDGGYVMAGNTFLPSQEVPDVLLVKTAPDPGIEEEKIKSVENSNLSASIFRGPLLFPEGRDCKVFDITGRIVAPDKIKPGIYFIEIDGLVTNKVVKVR